MRKVPLILKSTISIASGASTHYYKGHPNFAGVEAMITLIKFGQYFIQGHSFDSESIRQLDLSKEEFEKLMKKKKNRNTASLAVLLNNEAEREYLFSLLSDNRKAYIKECLDYFPTVELNHSLKIEGQEEDCKILANDGFQVILNIKTNRKSRYCQSNNYPFLKM